jgi:hypothetical protein
MQIPRFQLFELEDQAWFPTIVRDLATDYLAYVQSRFSLHRPIVGIMAEALAQTRQTRIIDLCSGGSGPILALQNELVALGLPLSCVLTDRYPNLSGFKRAVANSKNPIEYRREAVDARAVPVNLVGFRTLFNAFHHFTPADATAILRNATQSGYPIGIFEISDRALRTLVATLFLTPFVVLFMTPFIRPLTWSRLLWTYLIPLVPLVCWWDGFVSNLRAYRPAELLEMAKQTGVKDVQWRADRVYVPDLHAHLTYLIGIPASASN